MALLAASCSDDEHLLYSDPDEFGLNPVAIVADASGGTYELKVTVPVSGRHALARPIRRRRVGAPSAR